MYIHWIFFDRVRFNEPNSSYIGGGRGRGFYLRLAIWLHQSIDVNELYPNP